MGPRNEFARRALSLGIGALVAIATAWCAIGWTSNGVLAEIAASSSLHVAVFLALVLPVLRKRPTLCAVALAGIVLGCARWTSAGYETRASAPGTQGVVVAVANLYTNNPVRGQAIDAILAHHPDLVCLLETARDDETDFGGIPSLPHQIWDTSNVGIALLSSRPIIDGVVHREVEPPFISGQVTIDGSAVTVIACHLSSPVTAPSLSGADRGRAAIRRLLAKNIGPAVVVGDFNMTSGSSRWAAWRDATDLRRPPGLEPATWPSSAGALGIAIDHVFARGIGIAPLDSVELRGSDHRGLVTRVGMATSASGD